LSYSAVVYRTKETLLIHNLSFPTIIMLFKALAVAAAIGGVVAQRPNGTSICDYYTTALLKNNTAANQMTLLTLVVNTAVIGNYTTPNVGITVPGILAPGTFNGTAVNLLPYFDGALLSSNGGGGVGISKNFLDGGGAAPLMMNLPAFANATSSNQYLLLTHLYEYFGTLLGCTMQGSTAYPAYSGSGSMYTTHKFMDLSAAQVGYFIQNVAYSAASFGVAESDLMIVGTALGEYFDVNCGPEMVIIPTQPAALQSICTGANCTNAVNATCSAYQTNITAPAAASTTSSGGATATSSMPGTTSAAGAAVYGISGVVGLVGFVAALL